MTHQFQLNCSVFGHDNDDVFQVTLDGTQSIADLKEAIKQKVKPTFGDIPAGALTLWKVDSKHKKGDETLTRFDEKFLSFPMKELENIFPRECLHVFVGLPAVPGE